MILYQYYLSEEENIDRAINELNISLEEIEEVVGRFNSNSHREGRLRGKVVLHSKYGLQTRHHFINNKVLWEA